MKKRLLALAVCSAIVLALLPNSAMADAENPPDDETIIESGGG